MEKVNEDKMRKSIDKAIEHQNYITAMKGIACIAVALSHYIGIFKYAEVSFAETPIIDFISMIHADFLLGDISFGVYSFHWPIYCSLGAALMLKLWSGLGAKISVIIAIIVSMGMVIAVSYIFSLTCERWSSLFLKNIERYAKRINKED